MSGTVAARRRATIPSIFLPKKRASFIASPLSFSSAWPAIVRPPFVASLPLLVVLSLLGFFLPSTWAEPILPGDGAGGVNGDGEIARPEVVLADVLTRPFAPVNWTSSKCWDDSVAYHEELRRYAPWAIQMHDASAKIPSGVITGNYQQLGNYDECLRVKSDRGFVGQACNAKVHFEVAEDNGTPRELDLGDLLRNVAVASNVTKWIGGSTIVYEWMWCIPSSCNHTDVQEALEVALDPLKVDGRVDLVVDVTRTSCRTLDTDRAMLNTSDWIYISIVSIFAAIVLLSTTYDLAKDGCVDKLKQTDKRHVLFTAFSFYSNLKNLLRTSRQRDSIASLDGLRYISICWIIYGHTYYVEAVGVKIDLTEIPRMHHHWSTMLVLNGNVTTDTFFLLSGILLAYTEMIKKEKNPKWSFSAVGLYVHRYLRLTPAYAMMIGFYATLFYKVGSGPHWDTWVGSNHKYCQENWWTNLLYVNNYVNIGNICMSQTWYLATDMQLVWLSPIFLYPMVKFKRSVFFWLVLGVGLVLSVLLPFLVTYVGRLTGTMIYYRQQTDLANVFLYIYTRVYTRTGPYLIGLGLGYSLWKMRSSPMKLSMRYVTIGWVIATVVGLSAVFGIRGMYFEDHTYDRLEASFYAGFHRHAFALAVSWIVFASTHGYAGFVGQFLSWRGWLPLSKLTYSAYLCHYVFLLSHAGSVRTATDLTPMNVLYTYCGNLALTMALSLIWTLFFEMPFMTLDRAFLYGKGRCGTRSLSKPSRDCVFGSAESSKEEIYKATSIVPKARISYEAESQSDVYGIKDVCDWKENLGYCVIDNEERPREMVATEKQNCLEKNKDEGDDNDDDKSNDVHDGMVGKEGKKEQNQEERLKDRDRVYVIGDNEEHRDASPVVLDAKARLRSSSDDQVESIVSSPISNGSPSDATTDSDRTLPNGDGNNDSTPISRY